MRDRVKTARAGAGGEAGGCDGLVAVEIKPSSRREEDRAILFVRRGYATEVIEEPFVSFIIAEQSALAEVCSSTAIVSPLTGSGALNAIARFPSLRDWSRAKSRLAKIKRGSEEPSPRPLIINDLVQQHMILTGRLFFQGMVFDQLNRMQVDIETYTAPGFEFCNAERESDRIVMIAMGDSSGWETVLYEKDGDERQLLERFVETVRERDPDVIEGHNIFKFDLPYIAARAKRHGALLKLGRDGSLLRSSQSRFTAGERAVSFQRFEIAGRHIVDTYLLLLAYDVSSRSLESYGLKQAAVHFQVSAPNRTYISGSDIARQLKKNPELVMRYALDDIKETRALAAILARSAFAQAGNLPLSYQSVCLRGSAAKIDALMLREYALAERALPVPENPRPFLGGYTDIYKQGVVRNVHHCDARSLYPSIMLSKQIGPKSDEAGAFLKLLKDFRALRLGAKEKQKKAKDKRTELHYDALQSAFKILINSFYGYLGFSQARFNDFDAAERVAAEGRAILTRMVEWLRANGAEPVEVDTDGVYFVPPPIRGAAQLERFRAKFQAALPEGIEVEFDGEYKTMFSYKMKNYALLDSKGKITIRGAALKSRGLEPYLRDFLKDLIRLKLEEKDAELPALLNSYKRTIAEASLPIKKLAKTETLLEAPEAYAAKIATGARARSAAYELALRSGQPYQAGDQISYYITGSRKTVSVHRDAKRLSDWDGTARDENSNYYIAKLVALYERLMNG